MNAHAEDRVYTQYYIDVSKTDMTNSVEDERKLFDRYYTLHDLTARRKIIEGSLRFVIKIAKQYAKSDLDFQKTLTAAGNVGLLLAFDRYCPWVIECHHCHTKNYVKYPAKKSCKKCKKRLRQRNAQRFTTRFLTYAMWWILEQIRTSLYESPPVYIPPYKQKEQHRNRKLGSPPEISYYTIDDAYDEISQEEEPIRINDRSRKLIRKILSDMDHRHSYVLMTYFGFREESKTLREIAQKMGVCPERVRQIKVEAMTILRERLMEQRVSETEDILVS